MVGHQDTPREAASFSPGCSLQTRQEGRESKLEVCVCVCVQVHGVDLSHHASLAQQAANA